MKLSNYKPEQRFFGLFIGRSGSGKSCAAASFPAPHICDFDGRIAGVANYAKVIGQEVEYDYFAPKKKGWADVDRYLETLGTQIGLRVNVTQTEILEGLGALCRFFIAESIELQGGQSIGIQKEQKYNLRVEGPNDYRYETSALQQVLDYLKSLQINIICENHIIDRFGKPGVDDTGNMSESELKEWQRRILETVAIGEQLDLRPKLEQLVLGKFDEVYRFRKEETTKGDRYYVKFQGDLARTTLPLPAGEWDITGQNFYKFWKGKLNGTS